MKGHDVVWHLGANTDIPSGFTKRRIDLDNDVVATCNVLDAMVDNGIKDILFASTGAVYGDSVEGVFRENSGPLIPLSLYGAGKSRARRSSRATATYSASTPGCSASATSSASARTTA